MTSSVMITARWSYGKLFFYKSYGASLVVVLRCISLPRISSWLINWWLVVIKIWMISKCCLMSWASEIANRHKKSLILILRRMFSGLRVLNRHLIPSFLIIGVLKSVILGESILGESVNISFTHIFQSCYDEQ